MHCLEGGHVDVASSAACRLDYPERSTNAITMTSADLHGPAFQQDDRSHPMKRSRVVRSRGLRSGGLLDVTRGYPSEVPSGLVPRSRVVLADPSVPALAYESSAGIERRSHTK